jgi:uncharacterized protein YbaR (Trm112 family)
MKNTVLRFLTVAGLVAAAGIVFSYLSNKSSGQYEGGAALSQPSGNDVPLGGPVSQDLLDYLVCPEDKGPLELVDEGRYLLNPRNGYRYPIRDGIPIMLIEEGKANRATV